MPDLFIPKETKAALPTQEGHSHPFASFCTHPENVTFANQDKDEKILLLLRRHFITNFFWILTTVILLLIPSIFNFSGIKAQALFPFLPGKFLFLFFLFYYLLVIGYAFTKFITWYYNIFLVTQKRIIDIDYSDIVYHNVAMTKLSLVEDVSYAQVGFIRSLFNFGDLFVQTAGEIKHFEALKIPKPNNAAHIIEDIIGDKNA